LGVDKNRAESAVEHLKFLEKLLEINAELKHCIYCKISEAKTEMSSERDDEMFPHFKVNEGVCLKCFSIVGKLAKEKADKTLKIIEKKFALLESKAKSECLEENCLDCQYLYEIVE